MTSKILVPYDVSQYSNDAFQNALEFAKKFDAKRNSNIRGTRYVIWFNFGPV